MTIEVKTYIISEYQDVHFTCEEREIMETSNEIKLAEEKIARFRECFQSIQKSMETVLVGQKEVVRLLSTGIMSGGHMLLIGVPGLAKTLMARVMAKTLG